MTLFFRSQARILRGVLTALLCVAAVRGGRCEPAPAALAAFNSYVAKLELRLAQQHTSEQEFVAGLDAGNTTRLRRGEPAIERLSPAEAVQTPVGAMLHHWRGTAFVQGANAADFERLMKNFKVYPQVFSPQIVQAQILTQRGDHLQATMRVRQRHVITVVMDTVYDIEYGRLDARHGYSSPRSVRIAEIDAVGTPNERALGPGEEHGFLWRLNTYWTYEERDGGLYMQIESASLTRAIPRGLGWAIAPFVESVPRDSLEFTLRATLNALRK